MRDHSAQYVAYMKSKQWRFIRQRTILNAGGMCERCYVRPDDPVFGRPLEVHHKTYERLGHERMEDVEALCHPCHEQADAERATEVEEDRYEARLTAWATKVYGSWSLGWPHNVEELFDEWLDRKEGRDE